MLRKIKRELNALKAPKKEVKSFKNDITAIAPDIKLKDIFRTHKGILKSHPATQNHPVHPSVVLQSVTDEELRSLDLENIYDLRDKFLNILGGHSPKILKTLWEILTLIEHATEEAQTGESAYTEGAPLMREEYS